ncbi:alpha-L-fucosidase [Compostibacter hankyongensis]|uniref:alpha-L-fucosidase n=1 Tax=Compostibacter hankyongensis TaxID=1007089 RepID=A0ABP8FMA3_9BACT
MSDPSRRRFIRSSAVGAGALLTGSPFAGSRGANTPDDPGVNGAQRLSLSKLKQWESLGYGMFIHFGMSTFVGKELPEGTEDPERYAPDRLDVDQWIATAHEAGMKYAVLTTKHVSGHCLWPSQYTDYTVASSPNKTDVVLAFVKACRKYGILPGFYYCSWDNHHKFGSMTPSDLKWSPVMNAFPTGDQKDLAPFTSSMYQTFQTAQLTELLTRYGPIGEVWIDIPGVLGQGYRSFLYQHIAGLQPDALIMMNSGISDGEEYNKDYAWPSDLIAIERSIPPASGHKKWRTIDGKKYYMPGEVCVPLGKEWFYVEGDDPRSDDDLSGAYKAIRRRGANLLLDVPPDRHGLIPEAAVKALSRLRKNARIAT